MSKKNDELTQELVLSKSLIVNEEYKKVITSAEGGRYSYFDFSKEKVQEIALKDNKTDLTIEDARCLVQALFPQYLICSGLFDSFLMCEINDGKRIDPPKYCYGYLDSYLNKDDEKKFNNLSIEIVDLFKKNNITYHENWNNLVRAILRGDE